MAKRNYKIYADLGFTPFLLEKKLTVLDTGAGPNFIRKSDLAPGFEQYVRYGPLPSISDANRNPLRMLGTIELLVRLQNRTLKCDFIICERLAAAVILGADFCDRFVEAIHPRKKNVELDDGTTIPIVRRPLKRLPASVPLPPPQEFQKANGRTSPKVKVAKAITLPAGSQTWVTVTTKRHGLMALRPNDALYQSAQVLATNGVVQVEPDKPFRILIANFKALPHQLVKNQVVGQLLPHPTAVIPSKVSVAEVLGIFQDPEVESPEAKPADGINATSF